MFSAILSLLAMPFTDLSRSRGIQFKPLSKIAFYIFVANFLVLMVLGAKHVESPFIEFGQISTVLYFSHYFIIVPIISLIENSLTDISLLNNKNAISAVGKKITASLQSSLAGLVTNAVAGVTVTLVVTIIMAVVPITITAILITRNHAAEAVEPAVVTEVISTVASRLAELHIEADRLYAVYEDLQKTLGELMRLIEECERIDVELGSEVDTESALQISHENTFDDADKAFKDLRAVEMEIWKLDPSYEFKPNHLDVEEPEGFPYKD